MRCRYIGFDQNWESMMKCVTTYLLFLIYSATPLCAGTYWVSADGQATWELAESSTPLSGTAACSLATAGDNAQAGDTVFLRAGDYVGQEIRPRHSGNSVDEPIVFSNYETEKVIFRESQGIFVVKQSHITVKGIEFRSMRMFFRIFGSHYINIENCLFDGRSENDARWAGGWICEDRENRAFDPEDSTHNRVAHCKFFRWYWQADIGDRGALFDVGIISSTTDKSSHNIIEHNEFAYGGHHCLGVFSRNNVIRNNYFHNETDPNEWDYPGYRGAITQGSAAGRNLWEGNRFGFCDQAGMGLRSPYNIIRRNFFYQNKQGGLQVVSNAQYPGNRDAADFNRIYHNTFYHNGHRERFPAFQGGIYFANWRQVSAKGNVIKNNLFYDNKNGNVSMESRVVPQIIEYNWDNSNDPLFVDMRNGGPHVSDKPILRLQTNSPSKDEGAWLTTIESPDGEGTSFNVFDANYFMDGWGIIAGDRIQLEGQDVVASVTSVDYSTNTIVVDRKLEFVTGQGVALAYAGSAPEPGAFEIPAGP